MKITKLFLPTWAFLAMVIGLLASPVHAAQVRLAWDAATGGPSGYKLYYGQTSGSYQSAIDVGLQTSYTVSGLADGQRYYFSVTAYNAARSETNHSNEVTTVTASSPGPSAGLVAAYKFDEGSGTTVTDASGLGNHGTISGATRTTSGRYGRALVFDGVNDWVTIPDASSLDLTTGMTLEAWVYPTTTPTGWRAVLVKEGSNSAPYYLYANSDAGPPAAGGLIGGAYHDVYGGTRLVANTWAHLAATYDGTTERLYVNGVQVASRAQTGAIGTSTGALRLGGNSVWGEYFKGRIDEVRVYNRGLTAGEIQTDMNTPVGSAATMRLAATDTSEVSGGNTAQPAIKARIASAMDKIRAVRSTSVASHTPKSSSNKTSSKALSTFVQALDSELMQVGEVDIDQNWTRIELTKSLSQ
jgi:Concanavalin A-like lectin/glucanases superfamily/Fibronectin type III domain